jgi:hypothetical protein
MSSVKYVDEKLELVREKLASAAEKLGVDVSKQGRLLRGTSPGFTKPILDALRGSSQLSGSGDSYRFRELTASGLLRIAGMLPSANIGYRADYEAPPVAAYVEVARREPRALFDGYVVTAPRSDERFAITAALIPADNKTAIDHLRRNARDEPFYESTVTRGGVQYVRMSWG